MKEMWKPVVGYEGRYEVSDHGRVRSVWFRNMHTDRQRQIPLMLQPWTDDLGYKRVCLCGRTPRPRKKAIHQMVLEAFIGSAPTKYEAAHLDGNPSNNSIGNLRWVSHSQNLLQRYWQRGCWPQWNHAHPRRYFDDRHLRNLQILYALGVGVRLLSKLYGCGKTTVRRALSGYIPTDSEREYQRAYGRIYRDRVRSQATAKP